MQQLNRVSFLLLLVILSFATAHRELLMVASHREEGLESKLVRAELSVVDGAKASEASTVANTMRSKVSSGVEHSLDGKSGQGGGKGLGMKSCVTSRKVPARFSFDGHIPFTADYHSPQRHPPKNN